ncbi:O-antigen/teichoic acid export membrane protein [Acholeplasma morum]|nr:O-antigen/teichoic acid export membrane protein [Paracholeplasma morum]
MIYSELNYSYYKLFILFMSYAGIFNFGLIDGIYLYYAGSSLEDLPINEFKYYTKFLSLFIVIAAFPFVLFSTTLNGDRSIIVLVFSLNIILINLTGYFQFISQITSRFREFAIRNFIFTILSLISVLLIFIFENDNYLSMVVSMTIINFVILIMYVITYRRFLPFGLSPNSKEHGNKMTRKMYRMGIPLLLSNLIVILIGNIPKQFVEFYYPIENYPNVFAHFSFAYTLMTFTSVFLSAISLVIYPVLNKTNESVYIGAYNKLNTIIIVFSSFLLIGYFPLFYIVDNYIPKYFPSLEYFYILIPGVIFTSSITVIQHSYYKTMKKNFQFLLIGVSVLFLQVIMIYILYYVFNKSLVMIAISTLATQILWFLISDQYIIKITKQSIAKKNYLYISSVIAAFYSINAISNIFYQFVVFSVLLLLISLFVYFNEIRTIIDYLLYQCKKDRK